MVYKHPIEVLQEDLEKILEHGSLKVKEILNGPINRRNIEGIPKLMSAIKEKVQERTQVELQKQQRKETEDAVFIQGESIKTSADAKNMVMQTLQKKLKTDQIGQIVQAEEIKTKRKEKLLFKVQMKPKRQHEIVMKKNGSDIKLSQTSALFSILRENNENYKRKGKWVNIQRQIPAYIQDLKKKMDLITRDLRLEMKYQTKTGFNVKENTLVAKFREDKNSEWKDIFENREDLPGNIQDRLEDISWVDIVTDEKKCLDELTKF